MAYLGRKGASAALTTADIPDNSITSAKIVDGAVAVADIGTNAVGADELANDAVDTNAIADDAITGDKLANDIAISTTGAITFTGNFTSVGIDDNADANANTIDSSERGGINATSPRTKLEIVQSAFGAGEGLRLAKTLSEYWDFDIFADSGNKMTISNYNAGQVMTMVNDGKVGIGTTSPNGKVVISNSAAQQTLRTICDQGGQHIQEVKAENASGTQIYTIWGCYRGKTDAWRSMSAFCGDGSTSAHADKIFDMEGNGDFEYDGSLSSGAADYAEYIESTDGERIPVGTSVVLVGDKVRAATSGENPLGVVRPRDGCASIIGNAAPMKWDKKWLRDDYGQYQWEEYTVTEWTDEDGKLHCYATDKLDEVKESLGISKIPDDAVIIDIERDGLEEHGFQVGRKGEKLMRRIQNPDWDKTKQYMKRERTDEWNLIGLLGQIPVKKGQPIGSNWIKMKDISDATELYFVK